MSLLARIVGPGIVVIAALWIAGIFHLDAVEVALILGLVVLFKSYNWIVNRPKRTVPVKPDGGLSS